MAAAAALVMMTRAYAALLATAPASSARCDVIDDGPAPRAVTCYASLSLSLSLSASLSS